VLPPLTMAATAARHPRVVMRQRKDRVDFVVEGDDGNAIVGAEQPQQALDRGEDSRQRFTAHRTRTIDDGDEVERTSRRRCCLDRGRELEHRVEGVAEFEGDQVSFEMEIGLQRCPFGGSPISSKPL
jgi:hypothetical protein